MRRGRVFVVLALAVLALAMAVLQGCGSLTGKLTGTPIGWQLTGYQLDVGGPVDGWDELKGYYQGRMTAGA